MTPEPPTRPPEPSNTLPSPERRFIQRHIVQPLIQWAPLGGSGWLFVSFLLRQEWAQVLLTFPVTLVTAVWAAYSRNFVERLSEIYAERGRKDADALTQSLDTLNQALQWQLSGFEAKYLKCQRLDCHDDEAAGVKDEDGLLNTPLLQEVFVPLRLSVDALSPGYALRPAKAEDWENCGMLLIWDLLRQGKTEPAYRQIAIRAWGGYGKTTLLKHVAYTYSSGLYGKYRAPKRIPFLLYLSRCWRELTPEKPLSLPDLLTQYHLPRLPQGSQLTPPPRWIINLLHRGDALVMFDGFDEVPPGERKAVSTWLSEQMRHYPEAVFILTSRPTAYRQDYTAKRPAASFWIEDFQPEQQQRFVDQWYLCQERHARGGRNTPDVPHRARQKAAALMAQIQARPELAALAGNPLLLNMMCRFHRDKQGADLPDRKVELYQDICELQLSRRPKVRGIQLLLSTLNQRQEVLQIVALAMMQRATPEDDQGFKQIRREDLLTMMAPALADRDAEVDPEEFLDQIVDVSELVVQKEQGIYEFAHLSFQEFLAASEVVRLKQEALLYDQLGLDAWKPTLLLYGELTNPTSLIREALRRQALPLADQLWRTTPKRLNLSAAEQRELAAVGATVQTSRYAQLEAYLKAQQWREADQETYRLMITAVGKEEGDWFTREELENFPCEDLKAIDGLWVSYSRGKFGFTVQKQIWQECGSPKTPGKDLDRFCVKVGWQDSGGIWVDYKELTANPDFSPAGEFPQSWHSPLHSPLFGVWGGVVEVGLFSRIETCKL